MARGDHAEHRACRERWLPLVDPGERAHVGTAQRNLRRVGQIELAAQDRGTSIDDRDRDLVRAVFEVHERAAIEEADPEARNIVAVLDGIPGAYEHALQSLERARAGETIALDEF